MARRLLVTVGLRREGIIVHGDGTEILRSGARPEYLRQQLRACHPQHYSGVVSFGLAGGLDPCLSTGDIILADSVVFENHRFITAPAWREAVASSWRQQGVRFKIATGAGVERLVRTPKEKSHYFETTGAAVIDMESHIAGAFAASNNLPFLIIRAVSDPANRALPELAATALNMQGDIDLWRVTKGILRRPWRIPALIQAGRDSSIAFAQLERLKLTRAFFNQTKIECSRAVSDQTEVGRRL